MRHLTVRNVPKDLARALDGERKRRRASLNQTVLDLLRQALGLISGEPYDNGLGKLAGTWSDRDLAEFEANTAAFEQVDEELWK